MDHGNLNEYYYNTGNFLSRIYHEHSCDLTVAACRCYDHTVDIGSYYCELVHVLTLSAASCIPRVPTSGLKHYWSATLADLRSWSVKTSNKIVNVPNIDGETNDGKIAEVFRYIKFESQAGVCIDCLHAVDLSHDEDDVNKWMLSVEDVDYVIRNNMKSS